MTIIMALVLASVFGISYVLIRRGTVHLRQVQSKLEMLAITDVLTGIANRGHVMIRGEEEFARVVRNREKDPQSSELCCIMLDIDHFKHVNDTWGHQAGDQVLREVALRLRRCVRPYDIIGRYGGEEFMVLMPDTTFDQGLVVAERIRTDIRSESICIGADEIRVSVSLGVSCSHENDRDLCDLIKKADQGLYKAKDGGRDRVEWICSPSATYAPSG
jgi:two-component system cell cycle response regulator